MNENFRKELLSLSYVRLVCSLAGFSCSRPELDIDSVDLLIHASGQFSARSPSVGLQLKATADQSVLRPDRLAISLGRKNYDDLRRPTQVPRFLVVMLLPTEPAEWFGQTEEALTVRRGAYWVSLLRAPATAQQTITVDLPRTNLFTPVALRELMEAV